MYIDLIGLRVFSYYTYASLWVIKHEFIYVHHEAEVINGLSCSYKSQKSSDLPELYYPALSWFEKIIHMLADI